MAEKGLLPEATTLVLDQMVADFKVRHRTGAVDHTALRVFIPHCDVLGGNYNRFSCDNSEPKSIVDQMVESLTAAKDDGCFVPWSYVFGDYSVSGLDSSRQGYNSYKHVLKDAGTLLNSTYIADFTRASRDELEWWKLAALSKKINKGMVGAEDHFNLNDADWDMKLTMYGLLSRLFIKSLRQKVLRGMRGTARKGGSLGKPPLGYTRKVLRDENGNVVIGRNDKPKKVPCIDPGTCQDAVHMFELFVVKGWTPYRIMKDFNQREVDGWNGWTEGGIRKMLFNPSYVGVFIWNRTRKEYDWDKEKWVTVENPRSEWEIHYDPDLAIVPELWKGARRKLAASRRDCPRTGKSYPRRTATTLFSGTLQCGYCKGPIKLWKSGKYPVMYCPNGHNGKHGCELSASKSTRIIEKCILGFLNEYLLTPEHIHERVDSANAFLAEEASKPRADVRPLNKRVRLVESKIRKLVLKIEDEEDATLSEGYHVRVKQLQRELNGLRAEIRAATADNAEPPAPLDASDVEAHLADLRGLLNQDIPMAAEAIRAMTGPITITQEPIPGKSHGARWIATFSPDLTGLLAKVANDKECPDSITLEYLCRRNWTMSQSAVSIRQRITAGDKVGDIARAEGVSEQTVRRERNDMRPRDAT